RGRPPRLQPDNRELDVVVHPRARDLPPRAPLPRARALAAAVVGRAVGGRRLPAERRLDLLALARDRTPPLLRARLETAGVETRRPLQPRRARALVVAR